MKPAQNLDGIQSRARPAGAKHGARSAGALRPQSKNFYERPAGLDGVGPRLRRTQQPNQTPPASPKSNHTPQQPSKQPPKQPKKRKTLWLTVAGTILAAAILIGGGLLARSVYSANLKPVNDSATEPKLIHIESGMSSTAVANLLSEQELIRSAVALRWHLRLNGISSKIQAGVYQLSPSLSTPDIAQLITNGETITHDITIISGTRLQDIADQFKELGFSDEDISQALNASYSYSILNDKPPAASLEGYLFPDTYHIGIDSGPDNLVDIMLANLESVISEDLRKAWAARDLNTHEALTLASIVQKEVSDPADQKRVAQVFLRRLEIGMKLEADPTFEYGAFLRGVDGTPEVDSPYNTYLHGGLPPGPISNVGRSAMRAVANPADTDYLYFLSAPDGTTYFSHTEAQHEANIDRYLR